MPESITQGAGTAMRLAIEQFWSNTGIEIDAAAMMRVLKTGEITDDVRPAIVSHLWDAEPADLADLIVDGDATIPGLKLVAKEVLPPDHRNRIYVELFR